MNEFEPVTSRQIDRLVDGELPSNDRRSLLVSLDHEPDGWRRVALAFLESQALREGMRNSVKSEKGVAPASTLAVPARTGVRWDSMVKLAACAVLIFVLGRLSNPTPVAPVQNINPAPETYASNDSARQIPAANAGQPVSHQTLRLELGNGQDVEVPVVENSRLQPEDILKAPPVIPVSMQRELLKSGRRVYEQRQLFEVMLEDGRRGIVPVSDVLVENAGWDVYQ